MPTSWMDFSQVSFNALLLLERIQIGWLPSWFQNCPELEEELAIALRANPAVAWFLSHKNPEAASWIEKLTSLPHNPDLPAPERVRQAELAVLRSYDDLLVYALDPAVYDAQPFLNWDSHELTSVTSFQGKLVADVGAGTGRLALVAAEPARAVFAVEPVANLRHYLKIKARGLGFSNVYPVDGLITDLPFPDAFLDVVLSGHVYGDQPAEECQELLRVTRPGGMVILCPGNNDADDPVHDFLVSQGFAWSRFEEPRDGWKRKYWKTR